MSYLETSKISSNNNQNKVSRTLQMQQQSVQLYLKENKIKKIQDKASKEYLQVKNTKQY